MKIDKEKQQRVMDILNKNNALTEAAKNSPYPGRNVYAHIVEINGISYTEEAIGLALKTLSDEEILSLLQTQAYLFCHSNTNGHGSASCFSSIFDTLVYAATDEVRTKIEVLRQTQ